MGVELKNTSITNQRRILKCILEEQGVEWIHLAQDIL